MRLKHGQAFRCLKLPDSYYTLRSRLTWR